MTEPGWAFDDTLHRADVVHERTQRVLDGDDAQPFSSDLAPAGAVGESPVHEYDGFRSARRDGFAAELVKSRGDHHCRTEKGFARQGLSPGMLFQVFIRLRGIKAQRVSITPPSTRTDAPVVADARGETR